MNVPPPSSGKKSADQEISVLQVVRHVLTYRAVVSGLADLDPKDGGASLLRNFGSHMDFTALYPRRWRFSFTR
jgi:hypothetical protein